jgi:phospholipase D1/2
VVIDDAVAFCGGIDLTDCRWDCVDHKAVDPRRLSPGGDPYTPVHDMMMMVEGPAARALGDLARARWKSATGKALHAPPPSVPPWPTRVKPDFRNVDVAVARTEPGWDGRQEVREIEALNLAALASAKTFVYIENQHFASRAIYEAVRALLDKPDGPEILVVNPDKCPGWVEEMVMGEARNHILSQLQHSPGWHRFRIFAPYGDSGEPVYVHSKCLIVDDHFLRVGSSNFNNRSMGFDKECDLAIEAGAIEAGAIEAGAGETERRRSIAAIRDKLIAEHLGVPADRLAMAAAACGSWIQAIEHLRRAEGRSLRPIPFSPDGMADGPVTDSILDPEHADRLPL